MESNFEIDLLLNGEIGRWVYEEVNWNYGKKFCFWDDEGVSWKAEVNALDRRYAAISIHWPQKIPKIHYNKFTYFLNIHPGYLPNGRGMYPVFWSIYLNEIAGVTTHQITDQIDSGPILFRDKVKFDANTTGGQLWQQIFEVEKKHFLASAELLVKQPYEIEFVFDKSPLGINRTKAEFMQVRDNPNLKEMDEMEINRLIRALTHPKYPKPAWVERYAK